MDTEEILEETLKQLLDKLGLSYKQITVDEEEGGNFAINVDSENPSLLIGYHGDNIYALQHLLKVLCWKKYANETFNISLDIDEYRKRQEENIIKLAVRKIDTVRRIGRSQELPPMSPYFRRKIHLMCMGAGYEDIETFSEGEGEHRHLVIKLKS
ncbi:KH domain-containing protein [Candidatus Gracilibacteria bacterium]|nr:KH domain-containing protein [Candidatus Gracilibacteria bacterium]